MSKNIDYKYGKEAESSLPSRDYNENECCKGDPRFRTDYSESMEPSRGPRTYPSVEIIRGK